MSTASITLLDSHSPIPLEKGKALLGCLPEFAEDPLAFFKRLAVAYPEVVEFRLPMTNVALVTSADLAHQILVKEAKRFRKADRDVGILGTVLGNGLVTNNDFDSHKTQRKLIQPGFHFRRIQSYAETMIDYTDRYVSAWNDSGTRDISDDMFKLTLFIVSKTLFNNDMEDMADGANIIGDAMHVVQDVSDQRFNQAFQFPDWVPTPNNIRIGKARKTLSHVINQMIATRKLPEGGYRDDGDLMSMLLQAKYDDGSEMSEQQIMDELITLFVAGHETTSNALTWTFYLLAKHPEVLKKLHTELDQVMTGNTPSFESLDALKYTEMVIKESMRLFPPAWVLNARQANEDIEIGGYLFPKSKTVFIAPYANHHNPRYFENPEHFDPERFTDDKEKLLPRYAYMPFGGGPRVCIGNSFAMMEAKLILATIAKRYHFSPVADQKLEPQAQITLSNKGGMRVKVSARD